MQNNVIVNGIRWPMPLVILVGIHSTWASEEAVEIQLFMCKV